MFMAELFWWFEVVKPSFVQPRVHPRAGDRPGRCCRRRGRVAASQASSLGGRGRVWGGGGLGAVVSHSGHGHGHEPRETATDLQLKSLESLRGGEWGDPDGEARLRTGRLGCHRSAPCLLCTLHPRPCFYCLLESQFLTVLPRIHSNYGWALICHLNLPFNHKKACVCT